MPKSIDIPIQYFGEYFNKIEENTITSLPTTLISLVLLPNNGISSPDSIYIIPLRTTEVSLIRFNSLKNSRYFFMIFYLTISDYIICLTVD